MFARVVGVFFVSLHPIMEIFDYKEARRYAMRLGLAVAGTWVVSFLMFATSFPSMWAQLSYLVGLASIPLAGIKIRKYRQQEPSLNILRCAWVAWFTFFCCVLLTTAVQYGYFALIDEGRMCNNIANLLNSPEVEEAYKAMNATQMLENFKIAASELQTMSIKDFVMGLMSTNFLLGFFFAILSLLCLIGSKAGEKANR